MVNDRASLPGPKAEKHQSNFYQAIEAIHCLMDRTGGWGFFTTRGGKVWGGLEFAGPKLAACGVAVAGLGCEAGG